MPNKIIIFGDSFADPEDRFHENEDVITWFDQLSNDYEIINYAKSGTGPHYSFKEYYKFISDQSITHNEYICIFLLSGEDRIHFHGSNPQSITHINWDFDKKKSWWAEDKNLKKEKIYYENFKSEIDFLFLTMHEELLWSNFKNLGFLYINSLLRNMKTIVFCTFGIKILSRMAYVNFSDLNNHNFFLFPRELGDISREEFKNNHRHEGQEYVDYRRNHLSQQNHIILLQNIEKIIKNNERWGVDLIPFKKNIGYATDLGRYRDHKSGEFVTESPKFIYE